MIAEEMAKDQKAHLFLAGILRDSTSSFEIKIEGLIIAIGKKLSSWARVLMPRIFGE